MVPDLLSQMFAARLLHYLRCTLQLLHTTVPRLLSNIVHQKTNSSYNWCIFHGVLNPWPLIKGTCNLPFPANPTIEPFWRTHVLDFSCIINKNKYKVILTMAELLSRSFAVQELDCKKILLQLSLLSIRDGFLAFGIFTTPVLSDALRAAQ